LGSAAYIKEVARKVMASTGYSRKEVALMEMQLAIMKAQIERESQERNSHSILLSDRSAVDPIVYAILTAGSDDEIESRKTQLIERPEFQETLKTYQQSIFILLKPIADWIVDDGIRLMEKQEETYRIFERLLRELNIKFRVLGPEMRSLRERVSFVISLTGV
jgi:nicotinamide riboside kinase